MPAVPNTPGNPWLVKGILSLIGIAVLGGGVLLFAPGGQIRIGAAPVTADADADVIITATAAAQVPLVIQGAAGQSDALQEWQDSTANAQAYITADGYGIFKGVYTGTSGCAIDYGTAGGLEAMVTGGVFWSSTTDPTAAKDTGMTRRAAGNVEINGGTAGTTAGKLSVCATASSFLTTQTITEEMTCATGATTFTSTAHLLPAGSYIIGVTARVTQAPADAVTWGMGISGTLEKFAENLQPKTLGQMTSTWATGHAAGTGGPTAQAIPWVNAADDHVVITFSGDPGATSAKIRVTVFYQTLTPPGS